jgi:GYD domain
VSESARRRERRLPAASAAGRPDAALGEPPGGTGGRDSEAYDIVTIVEAADDETATAAMIRLASQGNVRTTSMRGFSAEEARGVLEKSR